MTRAGRSGAGAAALLCALCVFALLPARTAASDDVLSIGVGLLGSIGVLGQGAPEPGSFTLPRSGDAVTLSSAAGIAAGIGVVLDLRLFERVGLELGAAYARESLGVDARRAGRSGSVELTQPAFRVPLLVKGLLPLGLGMSLFAVAGPVLSFHGLSEARSDPAALLRAVSSAEDQVLLLGGLGVEWKAPLPALDLRVPLSLRASFDPDDRATRVVVLPSDAVVLDSTPSYELALSLGASVFF